MLTNKIERNPLSNPGPQSVRMPASHGETGRLHGLEARGPWVMGCLLLLMVIVSSSGCKSAFRSNDASLGAGFYDQDGHYIGHWGGKAKGEYLGNSAPVMPHPQAVPHPHGQDPQHGTQRVSQPLPNTPHPSPMPPGKPPADNSGVVRISQ